MVNHSPGQQVRPLPCLCPLNDCANPVSIVIERAVKASPEVHDLITELNDVLGAAYERGSSTTRPFDRANCLSLMYASSLHGWTASRWAAAASRCSTITLRSSACTPGQWHVAGELQGLFCAGIEDEARGAGISVLRLETGTRQHEAIGLYQRMGFRPRGPFGAYAAMPARNIETSLFFEKTLS